MFKKMVFSLFVVLIVLFTIISCSLTGTVNDDDDDDDGGPTVTTVTVNGTIINGKTEALITTPVSITLTGDTTGVVGTALGATNNSLTVNNGRLSFSLPLTQLVGVDVTFVAAAEGYISSSARVNNIGADYSFTIKLTAITDAPTGVSVTQTSAGSVDATTQTTTSQVVISTDTSTEVTEAATITIPAGTKLVDSSGEALTGSLTATVGYFSPKEEEALRVFPGGLDVSVEDPNAGSSEDGFFVTGGFVSIEITDESGKSAETFNGGTLGVSVDIPTDLINPETGVAVTDGDIIPLWSYDPETGIWTKETEVTYAASPVTRSNSGKLTINFEVPHLSYWNIDWFNPSKLDQSRPIVFTGDGIGAGEGFILELYSPTRGFFKEKSMSYDGTSLILQNVPSFPLTITIYDMDNNEIGKVENASLGDTGNLNIEITQVSGGNGGTGGIGDNTVDFTQVGYQISLMVDDVTYTAELYDYFQYSSVGETLYVSNYVKNYYDSLAGSYTGPFSESITYQGGTNYVVCAGKTTGTTEIYHIGAYFASGGLQIIMYKADASGLISEMIPVWAQTDVTIDTTYALNDDFTYAHLSSLNTVKYTRSSEEAVSAPELQELRSIIQSGARRVGGSTTTESATIHRSGSRSEPITTPVTVSNIVVKTKILKVTTAGADGWLYTNVEYGNSSDSKIRLDFPIQIEFETFSDNSDPMDTSIKDLYVNDQLVTGVWSQVQHYDETVDVLSYLPPDGWTVGSTVYVDVPMTHKTVGGTTLDRPQTFYFIVGTNSVSSPTDLYLDDDEFNYLELDWSYEKLNQNVRFEIYRSDSETGTYALICDTTTDTYQEYQENVYEIHTGGSDIEGEYKDWNVNPGQTYYYKVRAVSTVNSDYTDSGIESGTLSRLIPLTLGTYMDGTIDTSVIDNRWYSVDVTVDTSYAVYVDHKGEGSGTYTAAVEVDAYYDYVNSSSGLSGYFYSERQLYSIPQFITASSSKLYIKVDYDEWNNTLETFAIKVVEASPLPAVTNITTTNGSGSIVLTWTDDATCDTYYVYRETEFSEEFLLLGTTTSKSYSDTNVEAGLLYDYKITGQKGDQFTQNAYLDDQIYFTGLSTTEITTFGTALDGTISEDVYDTGTAIVYSFATQAGKTYTIQLNSGSGTYNYYNTIYVYDSTGNKIDSVNEYSSKTISGDGNVFYIALVNYYSGYTYSIQVDESL